MLQTGSPTFNPHVRPSVSLSTDYDAYDARKLAPNDADSSYGATEFTSPGSNVGDNNVSLYRLCNDVIDLIDDVRRSRKDVNPSDVETMNALKKTSTNLGHWKNSVHWIWTQNVKSEMKLEPERAIYALLDLIEDNNHSFSVTIRVCFDELSETLSEIKKAHEHEPSNNGLLLLLSALRKDLDTTVQSLGQQLLPLRAFAETTPCLAEECYDPRLLEGMTESPVPGLQTDDGLSGHDSMSTLPTPRDSINARLSISSKGKQPRVESYTNRSSGFGDLYEAQDRSSGVSTDSSYFSLPNQLRINNLAQAERLLTGYPPTVPAYSLSPADVPTPQVLRKRNAPRIPAPEKDYCKTCVSRKQRARRSNTVQKYFCTICKEPFVEKADWKRHEETYQERLEEFQCDFCYAKYFVDKDFVTHHVQAHGCVSCYANTLCSEKKHVQESKRKRKREIRTGWGCGFCYHFSTSWKERCNHITDHIEHDHKTMADWTHSVVIYSLLQRPIVVDEWNGLLQSINRLFKGFAWDVHSTGRAEGYPDSSLLPQLQDALEYFSPDQDAAALVRKAYDLAVKAIAREMTSPVGPKDDPSDSEISPKSLTNDTESMTQFLKSIVNDDLLPTNVAQPEGNPRNDYSSSWLDFSSQ